MTTQLYRHFDSNGQLLYVGISLSVVYRLKQHRDNSSWFESIAKITVEHFLTREEAFDAETAAIETERPLFNIRKMLEEAEESRRAAEIQLCKLVIAAKITALNPVYTIFEASSVLRCSDADVSRLIKEGKLRAFRIGRKLYVTGWAIMEFLEYVDASARVEISE